MAATMRGAPSIALLSLRERATLYHWHKLRSQLRRLRRQHILGADRTARLYRLRIGPVEWCVHSTTCEGCVLGSMALAVLHAQNVVLGALTLHRPSHRVRCEGCIVGRYAPFSGASSIVGRFFRLGINFCGCSLPGMRCVPVGQEGLLGSSLPGPLPPLSYPSHRDIGLFIASSTTPAKFSHYP